MSHPNGQKENDMRIGVPTEIKDNEYRVGMVPSGVREVVHDGHTVFIQQGAGLGSGFTDAEYRAAGAKILATADDVFKKADMIVKVKEPVKGDLRRLQDGQLLFTYLHLAPLPELTSTLMRKKIAGVAYETITGPRRLAAAALADVRGRGPHVGAGRRVLPAEAERRPRRSVRRRAGRAPG
jgi:alanine dehydrogenase